MLNTICHFEIPADDAEALGHFYIQLFGWTIESVPGIEDYFFVKTVEGGLCGGMMTRKQPGQTPVNYVEVESVEESLAKSQELGAQVMVPKTAVPGMGWFAVIGDPQRNPLGFWQNDANAG